MCDFVDDKHYRATAYTFRWAPLHVCDILHVRVYHACTQPKVDLQVKVVKSKPNKSKNVISYIIICRYDYKYRMCFLDSSYRNVWMKAYFTMNIVVPYFLMTTSFTRIFCFVKESKKDVYVIVI